MSVCKQCKKDGAVSVYCTLDAEGKHHSFNNKASMLFQTGTKVWHKHGKLHRLDGPAWQMKCGNGKHYLNGSTAIKINNQNIIVGKSIAIDDVDDNDVDIDDVVVDDVAVVLRHIEGVFYEILWGNKKVLIAGALDFS